MELRRNQKGLSVLEVLVAVGIMLFVFMAALEFFRGAYSKQIEEEQSASFYQALLVFDSYLSEDSTCSMSLAGNPSLNPYNGGKANLQRLKRPSGDLFVVGPSEHGVVVDSIELEPTAGITPITNNGHKYYVVDLSVAGKTKSGKPIDNKKFPFRFVVNTDMAGKVLGCSRYLQGQAFMTCNPTGSLVGSRTIQGINYLVYLIARENAGGAMNIYCLKAPSGSATLYVCGPKGPCLVN
ncbi:MAG: type II secretion system protein [Bdellovibrio sp.]|nr:type II secretion system protein [Bdellovibrio sp.]